MHQESEALQQKTAVVLDTRVLAKRCLDLEQEIQDWRQRADALEQKIQKRDKESQQVNELVDFAKAELNGMKQRIQANIRAIEHHTGTQNRLDYMRTKLDDPFTSPQEIREIDKSMQFEVQHMYPSSPQSKHTAFQQNHTGNQNGILAYRFAVSNTQ